MAKKKKKQKSVRRTFYVELPMEVFPSVFADCAEPSPADIASWIVSLIEMDQHSPGVEDDPWYKIVHRDVTVWKSLGDLVADKPLDTLGSIGLSAKSED